MAFFKCFKENTITILENDSEDFEKGTTLLVHKSLTNLQSLSVLVTKDPLHISSWFRVAFCKLTNINNSKFNRVKLFMMFCCWIPLTQLLTKFMMTLDCWILVFVMEKPMRKLIQSTWGFSLPKDIGNGLRRYWAGMDHFLKDVSFMKLFLHPYQLWSSCLYD